MSESRISIFYFLCAVILLASSFPASAETGDALSGCRPAAIIFDQIICRDDLEQQARTGNVMAEITGNPEFLSEGDDTGDLIAEQQHLRNLIWWYAMVQRYGDDVFTIPGEKIEAFQKSFRNATEGRYRIDKKAAALLRSYLDKGVYQGLSRQKIEQLLHVTELSVSLYEKKKEYIGNVPDHFDFVSSEAERQLATQMLQAWHEDKILFDDYGGRLAETDNRLVPVDAYRSFYDYIRTTGELKLPDPEYMDIFADLEGEGRYEYFVPEKDNLAKKYFTDPAWQFRMSADSNRYEILRSWLDSLPTAE